MQFAQLLQMRELGLQIPDDVIIDAVTIQNKKKLMESIQAQKQQQQQMQQMQMQAAMEEQKARTDLAKARAVADRGLGVERISRVQENQALAVERRAAAVRDEETGLLNLVKAIKEIDDMDIQQLETLIELNARIKADAKPMTSQGVSGES
jgi:hypothetical protein